MSSLSRLSGAFCLFFAGAAGAMPLSELAGATHYHGLAFARDGSGNLLLATHHGLFTVDLAGEASQISPMQDFMGFSPDPAVPMSYYASGHPAEGGNSGFLASRDGGQTWTQISQGVDGPVDFHAMDASPADPATIYGLFGGLQISRDGGKTWGLAGAPPEGVIALSAGGGSADRLYAATGSGLYISEDAGGNWQPLAFQGEVVSLVEAAPDGAVYAFVPGKGLFRAPAAGAEFAALGDGFGEAVPLYLAIDPDDAAHLVIATHLNSLLESRDGGKSWAASGSGS
ncbi:MAG TPA: hypothetical protein PLI43_07250 [Albidovulum sp.]|uniref:hypothetical protein n=1 Tax=Albidovulum sp. TaxID=1872424 RepID=UPI002C2220F4|nr:hypothetical protein [Albidovulum sp.]